MASIFKKTKNAKVWHIAYCPQPNKRKVVRGCADYRATEALARKLETGAFERRRGIVDERADRAAKQQIRPLTDHVADFERYLLDKGNTEDYATMTATRTRVLLAGIDATASAHITLDRVQGWLADMQRKDGVKVKMGDVTVKVERFGASTRNHYTRAVRNFCRWMVKDNRATFDPLVALATVNADVDVKIKRRVLTAEQLQALLAATGTATSPVRFGLTGPERVLVYRLALSTGLRAGEIASLTVGDFHLDDGVVEVQAAYAKNRRRDELPLRADLLADLAAYLKGRPAAEQAIPAMPESDHTAEMLRGDLKATGIDPETPEGRYDFHALRHQFCSDLVASGANVKVAQALARHSTPVLTIGRYSHVRVHDRQAAVEALPDLSRPTPEPEQQRATGTDDAVAPVAPAVAHRGPDRAAEGNAGQALRLATPEGCGESRPLQDVGKRAVGHNLAMTGNAKQTGEGGIRTPVTPKGQADFKSAAFSRSATSPATSSRTATTRPGRRGRPPPATIPQAKSLLRSRQRCRSAVASYRPSLNLASFNHRHTAATKARQHGGWPL